MLGARLFQFKINTYMINKVTAMLMCLAAISASAQPKADIEVSYTAHHPNLRNGKDDLTSQYILLANADESKFSLTDDRICRFAQLYA